MASASAIVWPSMISTGQKFRNLSEHALHTDRPPTPTSPLITFPSASSTPHYSTGALAGVHPGCQEAGPPPGFVPDILVGREREMEELQAALQATILGHGRVVLLAGDPGIGKTRMAKELAAVACRQGAQVLIGRCYEGSGAPPFWPWVQIVRAYVRRCDAQTLRQEMGSGAVDIAQVITEVREHLPDLPSPPVLEPEQARFRFFDSLTTFFKTVGQSRPLVLILDDLHWADTPSLRLFQFLARELYDVPLLVIGTYRDVAIGRHHPLTQILGELAREPVTQSILLQGLTEREVACFVEHTTGAQPSATLVSALYKQTEGNPFFMTEIAHLLVAEGDESVLCNCQSGIDLPIPQRVREVIGRRLDHLSADCHRVLATAAVIGREFCLAVLKQVSDLSDERVLEVLEEAITAHVLMEVPGTAGLYSFSHALIRETLYSDLALSHRLKLHRHVGEALESLYAVHLAPHLAKLAHHFFFAVHAGGNVNKAIEYATQAGARATALLAYEEAVRHYEYALQLVELQGADATRHCELLLALGEAQCRAGNVIDAKDTFLQAATVARALGASVGAQQVAPLLARAALGITTGFSGIAVKAGTVDPSVVDLLEETLRSLGEKDSVLKAKVLGRLAMELFWSPAAEERRITLSQQAVELARRTGDAATLAYALNARRLVLWGPENVEDRLRDAAEIIQLAEEIGDWEMALRGHIWRITDLVELGDLQAAAQEIATYTQRAELLKQPFYLWFLTAWKAMQAGMEGRFTEAEQLAHQALTIGQRAQDSDAAQYFTAQMLAFRGGRGLKDSETPTRELVEQYCTIPAWRCALALIYADLGLKAEARREFEYFAAYDFANLPRDREWLCAIANLSQVCAFLRDASRAAILYHLLLPYADRYIVAGPAIVCVGSAARFLGLLAMTMGRWEEAQAHFQAALQGNTRIGARPLVALTQLMYAFMFLVRKQPEDLEQAMELVQQALATAQELGMHDLMNRVLAVAARTQSNNLCPEKEATTAHTREESSFSPLRTAASLFRQEGDYWTIAYQGVVFRLKHMQGLRHLAHLLRHPNKEFHVLDLSTAATKNIAAPPLTGSTTLTELGTEACSLGDAGEILDHQARAAYQRRLLELREELEEAQAFHDTGRTASVQHEIAFLTHELAAGVGLGGRNRKAASAAERARINITKRIKAAIEKIAEHSPTLELYLDTTIRTGLFCSYTPDPRIPVSWDF
jgi:tetratricopeptide (TPR) repeat protein